MGIRLASNIRPRELCSGEIRALLAACQRLCEEGYYYSGQLKQYEELNGEREKIREGVLR